MRMKQGEQTLVGGPPYLRSLKKRDGFQWYDMDAHNLEAILQFRLGRAGKLMEDSKGVT